MALQAASYSLSHFTMMFVFYILFPPLSRSDETEYEYSGSEEEDEEREMGEPRSVSSQANKRFFRRKALDIIPQP